MRCTYFFAVVWADIVVQADLQIPHVPFVCCCIITPKCGDRKQQMFYYAHEYCGSEIYTEKKKDS